MKLKDLTPEQKAKLKAEMAAEELAAEVKKDEDRNTLKEMTDKAVREAFQVLSVMSHNLSVVKGTVFQDFKSLIELKKSVYNVKDEQQSHTFTSKDGQYRIKLGYRVYDRWDDTLDAGIAKVREYLDALATDAATAELVNIVNTILKKDSKGMLKANRVLDLVKLAKDSNSPLFKDGVAIIQAAYAPEKSSYFIECEFKDDKNAWRSVPLSVSSVGFPTEK